MAVPYLDGNTQYCEDNEEYIHHSDIPTKHNDKCEGRSIFSVILDHEDFSGYSDAHQDESETTPTFEVIKPRSMDNMPYLMVLDASKSMERPKDGPENGQRINRLKQAAKR